MTELLHKTRTFTYLAGDMSLLCSYFCPHGQTPQRLWSYCRYYSGLFSCSEALFKWVAAELYMLITLQVVTFTGQWVACSWPLKLIFSEFK